MVLHFNMRHPFHPLCAYWIYPSSYHHGSEKNGCIFNRIVTIQIFCHFPLNHDHGRKNNTLERSLSVVGRMGEKTHRNPGPVWWNHTPIIPDVNPIIINHSNNHIAWSVFQKGHKFSTGNAMMVSEELFATPNHHWVTVWCFRNPVDPGLRGMVTSYKFIRLFSGCCKLHPRWRNSPVDLNHQRCIYFPTLTIKINHSCR